MEGSDGMRFVVALTLLAALAGCGADGEPVQPTMSAGVHVSPSGVNVGGGVGLNKGPFSLNLGF